jgi:hypothetical protein
MTNPLRFWLLAIFVGTFCAVCLTADAQEVERRLPVAEDASESWYRQEPTYEPNPRAIIHQKALARSNQRQSRLASLAWYGMYNARPSAAPTPFTSLYSPVWQQPGGRPFAWYASSRPTYVFYNW